MEERETYSSCFLLVSLQHEGWLPAQSVLQLSKNVKAETHALQVLLLHIKIKVHGTGVGMCVEWNTYRYGRLPVCSNNSCLFFTSPFKCSLDNLSLPGRLPVPLQWFRNSNQGVFSTSPLISAQRYALALIKQYRHFHQCRH